MTFDLARALPYFTSVYDTEVTGPIDVHGSKDGPLVRAFSPTLMVNYVVDEPGAHALVRERDVAPDLHEELHRRAVENLRAQVERRSLSFERSGALHLVRLDGQHDASLLLLDELWDPPTRIADPEGELVAAVPARSSLCFTGSTAKSGVAELRAAISRKRDLALSPEMFVRRERRWQPFGR